MTTGLSSLQQTIVQLAETRDLSDMTYREIMMLVGASHPYSVQQAIERLIEKGALVKNKRTGSILATGATERVRRPLLNIPILGKVSCGPATELPDEFPASFLAVSPSMANIKKPEITYALIAAGNSMSNARIAGKSVADGDYVIVEKREWGDAKDGSYVVSRYNDMSNLKRLRVDSANRRVVLMSESTEDYSPIIIAEEDMPYYAIEGIAVDVVKGLPA